MKTEEETPDINPEELQRAAVLRHLSGSETGEEITHLAQNLTALEALELYGIFRLSHIIWLLRRDGYEIETDLIAHKTKKRCKYARYSLKKVKPVN